MLSQKNQQGKVAHIKFLDKFQFFLPLVCMQFTHVQTFETMCARTESAITNKKKLQLAVCA